MLDAPTLDPQAVRHAERTAAHHPLQKIMVLVDPAALSHPCIEKAARIALAFGSSLEIFCCMPPPDLPETWAGGTTLAAYRGVLRERQIGTLETLAKPLRSRGLAVTADCTYTTRVPEAIIDHAIRIGADLVIKDVATQPSPHQPTAELDGQLIHSTPLPLLLVRAGALGPGQSAVSAILVE
jgi:nucleotide-binding universal stress UspA family protein